MAEEIWYSIVWEEEKQQSNVVDYNIREEQTKDTFNTDNANNQTTTGMANVIPWVNAPKLIASTSIIGAVWWGWSFLYSVASLSISTIITSWSLEFLDTITVTSAWWDISADWMDLYVSKWLYIMDVTRNTKNVNATSNEVFLRCYRDWSIFYIFDFEWAAKSWWTASIMEFEEWDYLRVAVKPNYNCRPVSTIRFVKLQ